jgi:hypothetical protein
MNLSVILEVALAALLGVTVFYCALLYRRLGVLRRGQDSLKTTIAELNDAITAAGGSMQALKAAAGAASETLDSRIARARGLADELSLVNASAERLADRIEKGARGTAGRLAGYAPPEVLAHRLESLRPEMPKPEKQRSAR